MGDVILARQPAPFNLTVNDQLELESWLRMGTLSPWFHRISAALWMNR